MKKSSVLSACLLIPTLFFSGCNWFTKGDECTMCTSCGSAGKSGEAIVTVDGKAAMTSSEMKETLDSIEAQQPGFMGLPAEQLKMFLNQIVDATVQAKLIEAYVDEKGWSQDADYKKNLTQSIDQMKRALAVRKLQEELLKGIKITEADAEEFYVKNRETSPLFKRPPFMSEMEGVEALMVKTGSEKEAKDILDRARKVNDLKKAASEFKKQAQNLGVVTTPSRTVDYRVFQTLMGFSKYPDFGMTPSMDGKSFFVLQALKKHAGKFETFEKVKEEVKKMVQGERFGKEFDTLLKTLKEKHKIVIDEKVVATFLPQQKEAAQVPSESATEPTEAAAKAA